MWFIWILTAPCEVLRSRAHVWSDLFKNISSLSKIHYESELSLEELKHSISDLDWKMYYVVFSNTLSVFHLKNSLIYWRGLFWSTCTENATSWILLRPKNRFICLLLFYCLQLRTSGEMSAIGGLEMHNFSCSREQLHFNVIGDFFVVTSFGLCPILFHHP